LQRERREASSAASGRSSKLVFRGIQNVAGDLFFLTLWATGMRSTKVDSPPMMAIQNVAAMKLLTFLSP
jgi:hypothetical protein